MYNIKFKNPEQIINMGGPWIGSLMINEISICENIIINNYIKTEEYYYFIKYFKISEKQKNNYFSVIRINMSNMELQTSIEKFDKIFIEKMNDNVLYYYDGFHNKLPLNNKVLNFYEYF